MARFFSSLALGLGLFLTACVQSTPKAATVVSGTVEPIFITSLPSDVTPPPTPVLSTATSIPPLPDGMGPTELKYRLLAEFPDFFFCDPDMYPVPRDDELDLARQRFSELQANREEFAAILAHNDLAGLSTFSDDQKLLIYREHKRLAAVRFELATAGYQFQLQLARVEGTGELVAGLIDGQGTISVQKRDPTIATCPICLAVDTLVDTPAGPVPVQSLRLGARVWTVDDAGRRVAMPLIRISKTTVPANHQILHLVLEDGRELWASPGHPTVEGWGLGQLKDGDLLDGAILLSTERVPYAGPATYDLLPAGETGFYWANGILIASTLTDDHGAR